MSPNTIVHQNEFLRNTIFNLVQNKKENREEISSRILKTVFEALLEVERDEFMKNKESQNKKNGYYSRLAKTLAGIFEIKVPRDRLGLFKSLILEIAKKEKQNLDQLAFELYSKGVDNAINEIYPKSKLQKCIVHLKRNIWHKVRIKDRREIMDNLKIVFDLDNALDNKEKALERMNQFISKWKKDYPFLTRMNISESHFTYLEFSFEIRRMIFNVDEDNGRRRKSLQISDYKALSC